LKHSINISPVIFKNRKRTTRWSTIVICLRGFTTMWRSWMRNLSIIVNSNCVSRRWAFCMMIPELQKFSIDWRNSHNRLQGINWKRWLGKIYSLLRKLSPRTLSCLIFRISKSRSRIFMIVVRVIILAKMLTIFLNSLLPTQIILELQFAPLMVREWTVVIPNSYSQFNQLLKLSAIALLLKVLDPKRFTTM